MAKNLRSKIAETDTMTIHDVNPSMTEEFRKEMGNVEIANSVREVAENSVCQSTTPPKHHPYMMNTLLFYL